MKLAITSLGESLDSPVDQRFGRARYFIFYDTDTATWSVHANGAGAAGASLAGPQAAQAVLAFGADTVLTGHCGPEAFAVLAAHDVNVFMPTEGAVRAAIASWQNGSLSPAESASVSRGFGRGARPGVDVGDSWDA